MNFKITDPIDFSIEIESLYIAHVFQNISKKKISTVFNNLFLANVKGIDLVTKIGKDGKPYNSAYIHIESWFDNSAAKYFQEKIRSDSEALLVYDEPWYWIVNENKSAEKSRFIRKAEEERFEGAQKQANDDISEMLMMLDSLEYICAKDIEELNVMNEDYEVFQAEYEEEEYNFLSEHKEEEEYFNNND
jgi:hypothetical protein